MAGNKPVSKATELQVLFADRELRAKVKVWVCLGNLQAGSGLAPLGWAPKSLRPLLPREPLTEPPVGTQDPEWGRRRDFRW